MRGSAMARLAPAVFVLLAACGGGTVLPPRDLVFEGLPVAGSRALAERLGFTPCFDTSNALRCRRDGVMLFGTGPYRGAVDMAWDGASGFRQLTLWHDSNQAALFKTREALGARGWTLCRTGQEDRGDQDVWTRPGSPVRLSMDVSYWGKRRLRILPESGQPTGKCW